MKNKSILVLVFIALLSSCGQSASNPFLGQIPQMVAQFQQKNDQMEQEIESCKDFEKLRKLDEKMTTYREQVEAQMKAYLDETSTLKPIPVQTLPQSPYAVKAVSINALGTNNLNLKFTLDILSEIPQEGFGRQRIWLYYKAIDSKGEEIPGTKTVASNVSRDAITVGQLYDVFGSWNASGIVNLSDFAGIVEITKEEYERK